jgi:hypothetical protein
MPPPRAEIQVRTPELHEIDWWPVRAEVRVYEALAAMLVRVSISPPSP